MPVWKHGVKPTSPHEYMLEEVQARVDIKTEDPSWCQDHEGWTEADAIREAVEDIISMEDDCGGAFEMGILPRRMKADGSPDHEAMERQRRWVTELARQHAEWQALRRAAQRYLATLLKEAKP